MRHILIIAVSTLALCAPALAQTAPEKNDSRFTVVDNRDSVSCRMPQALPGSRLGPVCKTSAEWAHDPT
jgi:hypothetical protein